MTMIRSFLRVGLFGLALCIFGLIWGVEADAQSNDVVSQPEATVQGTPSSSDGTGADAQAALDAATGPMAEFYRGWQAAADLAERILDSRNPSNVTLQSQRGILADYRQRFLDERTKNEDRISSLQAQIATLGPQPDAGNEPKAIALLRGELQDQLNALTVPQILADLAFNRAQGLISEIDSLIRNRATRKLLERVATPLNPENWSTAYTDLVRATKTFSGEISNRLKSDATQQRLRSQFPILLLLTTASLVLLLKGRHWSVRAGAFLRQFGGEGTGVWRFAVSLLQVALPYFGTVLLVQAIDTSGVLGASGTLLLADVPYWSFLLFAAHWLGERVYVYQLTNELVPYYDGKQALVRVILGSLAAVLVLNLLLLRVHAIVNLSDTGFAVLSWPLVLLAALLLLRLTRIRRQQLRQVEAEGIDTENDETAVAAVSSRAMVLLRQLTVAVAFAAPILGAVGYVNAALGLVYPMILTIGVVTLMLIVQYFLADVYGWLTGKEQSAQDSLFAGLVGFGLSLAALPVLSLIWGARSADLTELWARFLEGFSIGGTRISPSIFMTFVAIFVVGYVSTRVLQGSLRNSLLPKTRLDAGGQNAIVAGTGYIGIFLSALIAISMAGLDLSSVAIVAGALSVGIGFGLQTIVSNFVSGIILLIERPISKGDWIEVGGLMGYVRDISVRSTRIETFDRTDVIVPNSDLITGTVTNYTRGNTVGRVIVPVGVAYGTDPRRIEKILTEIARAHPMVLLNPAPSVVFQGFGADSLDFEIRAILRDVNWVLSVKSDMNYAIAKRFEEEGIEIPFAQRDIWIRNPEALQSAPSSVNDAGVAASSKAEEP